MYSTIKKVSVYEDALNNTPHAMLMIDKNTKDVLFWNIAYRMFLLETFKINPDGLKNIKDYPEDIQDVFNQSVNDIKPDNHQSLEFKIGEAYIKAQIINTKVYFFIFFDITEDKKILNEHNARLKELTISETNRKKAIEKNIKLWTIFGTRIVQSSFSIIAVLGLITIIIKDQYYTNKDETNQQVIEVLSKDYNLKMKLLNTITENSELEIKKLDTLIRLNVNQLKHK